MKSKSVSYSVMSDSLGPQDCSLLGSAVHGILKARILEWMAIPFSRDLPDPRIESRSPAFQADSLPFEPPGKVGIIILSEVMTNICYYYMSSCLFNLYAEYIMRNTGLEESQTGIKIAGRNINNLRYADDTTLMAESEAELKSLLMKVKEESEKVCLKLNIQKTKIMASCPITSWEIDGESMEAESDLFFGLQNHCDGDCSHEIKRCLLLGRKVITKPR